MSAFRVLHLRRLFEHRARTGLSLVGIAIGAALVVAVLGFIGTLDGSVGGFVEDLSGAADLEVSGVSDEGLPDTVFFDVEETEGVEVAVPMIRTPGLVEGRRALIVGLDQRARALGTQLSEEEADRLEAQAAEGGFVLGEALADEIGVSEGDTIELFAAGGTSTHPVSAVIGGDAGSLNRGYFAAAPLPLAQQATGKVGRLDSILVLVEESEEIEEVRGRLVAQVGEVAAVDSPAQQLEQAQLATRDMRIGLLMGAAIALTVGAFLVYNTMSVVATERRRELATLRALGGRKWRLLGTFLAEAATLGALGSAAGGVVGLFVSRALVDAIPPFVVASIGVELAYHLPGFTFPVAVGAGCVAAVVAAFTPAYKAVSVDPVDSMRPEGVLESAEGVDRIEWVTTVLGLAMTAGGFSLAVWGYGSLGFLWLGVMIVGVIVAAYGLTAPLTAVAAAVTSLAGASGRLAASAVSRAPRRAWATGVSVVVAAAMMVSQGGIFANIEKSLIGAVGSLARIDLYVSATEQGVVSDDIQLPAGWEDDLAAIDGVANVGVNVFSFITYRGQQVLVQGLEGTVGEAPTTVGVPDEEVRRVMAGEAAIVSHRFAELYGVGEGDLLEVSTPGGIRSVPVVAQVPAFTWERGMLTIGRGLLRGWFGQEGVNDYMLTLAEGADEAEVRREVERFVADAPLPVYLTTGEETLKEITAVLDGFSAIFGAMSLVVVGAAALAILNALLLSVVERRRELGIMRALGTSRRQARAMVALEAGALGLLGGLSGSVVGFMLHRASLEAVIEESGFPITYEFVGQPVGLALAIGLAISLLGSIFPAHRAGAVDVIEAIGYE